MATKQKDIQTPGQIQVNLNLDTTPILYASNISITSNPDGVVMDVMQRLGTTNQIRIVSRVGMSREHAKRFASELGRLLAMTEGQGETGKVH
jgi:hypothetical protein